MRNANALKVYIPEWELGTSWKFYPAYQELTDYGACCLIVPYLNLINPETRNIDPTFGLNSSWYHNIPRGARNGIQHGLKLMLDVESFDYAYYRRRGTGFKVALTNALDEAVINQDGFYIAPGLNLNNKSLKNTKCGIDAGL